MIRSGGVLVKSRLFTNLDWNGITQPGITPAFRWASYNALYRGQLWPYVLVNKIANATARLPLKIYRRGRNDSRIEAPNDSYARLLRNPNPQIDSYSFWLWVVSTLNIYGEAMVIKRRDALGRPISLLPRHPTRFHYDSNNGQWTYTNERGDVGPMPRFNFVHFKLYDPDDQQRGLSPLEPLRSTLENEDGSRRANSAQWRNGARPSVLLTHPGNLSSDAQNRLKAGWDSVHAGAENFAKTAVLEEGMDAKILTFNPEEMAYLGTRALNREECCAAYDIPPPVVHILDRATFSNITEQMRSMYRDTMAPRLKLIEATLDLELRDGSMGRNQDPDFSGNVYAEFLMDEVLRGAFETRADSYQAAINSGWLMPSEVRALENLPFVEGTDQVLVNSTMVPLNAVGEMPVNAPPEALNDPTVRRHLLAAQARLKQLGAGETNG